MQPFSFYESKDVKEFSEEKKAKGHNINVCNEVACIE